MIFDFGGTEFNCPASTWCSAIRAAVGAEGLLPFRAGIPHPLRPPDTVAGGNLSRRYTDTGYARDRFGQAIRGRKLLSGGRTPRHVYLGMKHRTRSEDFFAALRLHSPVARLSMSIGSSTAPARQRSLLGPAGTIHCWHRLRGPRNQRRRTSSRSSCGIGEAWAGRSPRPVHAGGGRTPRTATRHGWVRGVDAVNASPRWTA